MKNIVNVINGIPQSFEKLFAKQKIKINKYLPEIMLGGSIITGAAAIATTALASYKVKDKLDELDENNATDIEKALSLCKLYATPAGLAVTSVTLGVGAFTKMKGRYIGAVAAYNGIKMTFDNYRDRVKKDQGEEKDYEYMTGSSKAKIVNIDENGVQTEVEEEHASIVPGLSQYAIIWDEYLPNGQQNHNWDQNTNFNYMFLKTQESIMNDMLQSRGHVFLNEVLEAIGYPHTQAGAVVGWVKGHGDDIIDFGLYNNETERIKRFVNGNQNTIILDFNVDGVIYDLI